MSDKINPMGLLYEDFEKICKNIVIKYFVKAEEFETLETQQNADGYLDVINGKDNFFTYIDYTRTDYINAGWTDTKTIDTVLLTGNTDLVPRNYRDYLLSVRRQRVLDNFEEKNNYYRMLNGYPNVEDEEYYYPSQYIIDKYGMPEGVPIHKLQDVGNNMIAGRGDLYISILEGLGVINELIEEHPDKEYLKFLGSNRISIKTAREALNFQCIRLKQGDIPYAIYNKFLSRYDQCREYFTKTIYMKEYRKFLDYYDGFIAMCIMIMTIQQMDVMQLLDGVNRQFFSIYGVRSLYQAYNVPYDLSIDEDTQTQLVQNLNLLIQNKATNKVIYNLAYLLGFTNINIYKYYLGKERKFDLYGVPIVRWTTKFNTDTGEVETIPDYEKMYNLYFQREELRSHDLIKSFNSNSNTVKFEEIIEADPFWWTDEKTYKHIWEVEYNFVEAKYLGLGVSYSMTEVLFETTLLFKMLLANRDMTELIITNLPKITDTPSVPLYDMIVFLLCLTAAKHNLTGEIISIPTQVISVVDYMRNVDETDMLVDTLSFNFKYFDPTNTEAREEMKSLKKLLGKSVYNEFMIYADDIAYLGFTSPEERTKKINDMFVDAKNMYRLLRFHMTSTHDRKTYITLRNMVNSIYFSKEIRDIFTLTGTLSGQKRTAWTYYEYLYNLNPSLYSAFFEINIQEEWYNYLSEHGLTPKQMSLDDFLIQVEYGNIRLNYGRIKDEFKENKDTILYTYVNHCIDRISDIVSNLNLIYLINGSSTPLQDLLMKLIRFFKSYTVDLLEFETLFVLDFKPGNTVKLLDEMHYISKLIQDGDYLKLSHGDVVHYIQSKEEFFDKLPIYDKVLYLSILKLSDKDLCKIYDNIVDTSKELEMTEDDVRKLYDIINYLSTMNISDKISNENKFRESLRVYYDDREN